MKKCKLCNYPTFLLNPRTRKLESKRIKCKNCGFQNNDLETLFFADDRSDHFTFLKEIEMNNKNELNQSIKRFEKTFY